MGMIIDVAIIAVAIGMVVMVARICIVDIICFIKEQEND